MAINTGINENVRSMSADALFRVLSLTFRCYIATLIAHWNVKGDSFFELHRAFGKQYAKLGCALDRLAERIRALDYDISLNGEAMMLDQPIDTTGMVASLLGMHEESARTIREVFPSVDESGDLATAMLFEELGRYHEKIAWMLRAWLGGQSEEVPSPSEGPIS